MFDGAGTASIAATFPALAAAATTLAATLATTATAFAGRPWSGCGGWSAATRTDDIFGDQPGRRLTFLAGLGGLIGKGGLVCSCPATARNATASGHLRRQYGYAALATTAAQEPGWKAWRSLRAIQLLQFSLS
jgi:hypothetical protein